MAIKEPTPRTLAKTKRKSLLEARTTASLEWDAVAIYINNKASKASKSGRHGTERGQR